MKDYYTNPALAVRESKNGKVLFATERIKKGQVIANWEPMWSERMKRRDAFKHSRAGNHYVMQADDYTYFVSTCPDKTDYINHSCDPNIGLNGPVEFVAMRDIEPGEEIVFDYAISESYPLWAMECCCGSKQCRRIIRGTDWKKPELQERYGPYFSDYIKLKMQWHPLRRYWVDLGDFLLQKYQRLCWRLFKTWEQEKR